ncbi:hypothetical protein RchiOBHm_Chr7g0223031 [Rosa chinensis]|uniref:Uncharacterized protein n=1 Tax=Rosa chinensis TaxID=74649 RepID=A0A2P6PDG9_ROSCH|nr:hypothetical protein RchiOBHm_Chr7g0223031 [Rosa chinensis]
MSCCNWVLIAGYILIGEQRGQVDGTCSCLIVVQDFLAYRHKPCTEIHI